MNSRPHHQQYPLPSAPDLVFRVGFAGKRDLDEVSLSRLGETLTRVLTAIGRRLVEIAPGNEVPSPDTIPAIANFYSSKEPVLRIIHGLCEGADSVAFQSLEELAVDHLAKDFAAVVPFDIASYRASRNAEFLDEFDRQAAKCSCIVVPDGIYDRRDETALQEESSLADRRRSRGYRCQSKLMLRQSDLLVAAVAPDQIGKPGGTLETVRSALEFELPVVMIDPETGAVTLIEPGDDFPAFHDNRQPDSGDWEDHLRGWVTNLVADPDRSEDTIRNTSAAHGVELMEEFFTQAGTPSLVAGEGGIAKLDVSIRERLWGTVERHFKRGLPRLPSVSRLAPYSEWRDRAAALSSHYSGLYRGTYVLNHLLAVGAVFLASLSLVLIIMKPPGLIPTLLILGLCKLWIVVSIFRNTHQANHENWNDKAVDYRYLAERLRTLNHLPLAGSFQPPAAAPPQYASRVVRQSAVDWLFDAIVRSVPPAAFAKNTSFDHRVGEPGSLMTLNLDPLAAMRSVETDWISTQALYHRNNATAMQRMSEALERRGRLMNYAVIVAVTVDIIIVTSELLHVLPPSIRPWIEGFTPWLLFLAALLPAAVASLNGIRFQSECQRLADRSAVMHTILEGRPEDTHSGRRGRLAEAKLLRERIETARKDPDLNSGSWALETLHFSEKVADDFVQEVAEWSVLYAKELVEP